MLLDECAQLDDLWPRDGPHSRRYPLPNARPQQQGITENALPDHAAPLLDPRVDFLGAHDNITVQTNTRYKSCLACLVSDAHDAQDAVLVGHLELGDEFSQDIDETLRVQGKLLSDQQLGSAVGEGHVEEELVLVVLVQTDLLLSVALQSANDVLLLHLLSHCPDVPQQALSDDHAPYAVFVLGIEHFLVLDFELDLAVLAEGIGEDLLHVLPEFLAGARHLGVLDVVGDHHSLGLAQLDQPDGLNGLALADLDDHVALPHWEVPWLHVQNVQPDAHLGQERDEAQPDALQGRRPADIGPPVDLDLFCVLQAVDDGHQALHHEGAAGGSGGQDFLGLQELGVEVDLGIADLGHLFDEGAEDGAQLVVDARIRPVLADAHHAELLVEQQAEGERAADHLSASLVETAVDLDHFLHRYLYNNKRIKLFGSRPSVEYCSDLSPDRIPKGNSQYDVLDYGMIQISES